MSEWIKPLGLIDAKSTDDTWRVARVMSTEGNSVRISFIGMGSDAVVFPFTSKSLAPFRRYTCKHTGIFEPAADFIFNIDDLNRIESTIIHHETHGLSELSPYDITQFYRGELFFYIEYFIQADYSNNLPIVPRVVMFFTKALKLVIQCLQTYSSMFTYYYKGLEDPELYLKNKFTAMINSWPEILDTLNKLLGNDNRVIRFFEEQSFVPEDYEFTEYTVKESHWSKISLYLLNYFGSCRGFDILFRLFTAAMEPSLCKIPLNFLCALSVHNLKDRLNPELAVNFYQRISEGVLSRLSQVDELDLKDLDYSLISSFLYSIISFGANVSDSVIDCTIVTLLCKMIKSNYMEKRIKGINELSVFIENCSQKAIGLDEVLAIMADDNILYEILEDRLHAEILKRSCPLLKLYSRYGLLTSHECEIICSCCQSDDKILSEAGHSIVSQILQTLSPASIDYFFKSFISLPSPNINLKYVCDLSILILDSDIEYDIFTRNIFSELILDSSPGQRWMEAAAELSRLLAHPRSLHAKHNFFEELNHKFEENHSIPQLISVAIELLPTFAKDELIELLSVHQTKEKLIKNLIEYMKQLKADVSRNSIIGNFTHKDHVTLRLKFLETIAKCTEFSIAITDKEVGKLWKCLVLNRKSRNDANAFFTSLSQGLTNTPLSNDYQGIFHYFIDDRYFDSEDCSVYAFKAFKKLLFLNNPESIEVENYKYKYTKSPEIKGKEKLANLLINSDNRIAGKVIRLMKLLMTVLSNEIAELAVEIFESDLELLLSMLDQSKSGERLERILNLFKVLLNIEEIKSEAAYWPVLNTNTNELKQINIPHRGTVRTYRKLISESFGMPLNTIILMFNDYIYSYRKNHLQLNLSGNINIKAIFQPSPFIEFDPTEVLSKNPKVLELLHLCTTHLDDKIKENAWFILKNLPVHSSLRESFMNVDSALHEINCLSPHQFLQILSTLQNHVLQDNWLAEFKSKHGGKVFSKKYLEVKAEIPILIIKQEEIILEILGKVLSEEIENPTESLQFIFKTLVYVSSNSRQLENVAEFFCSMVHLMNYNLHQSNALFQHVTGIFLQNDIESIVKTMIDGKGDQLYFDKLVYFLSQLIRVCNYGDECLTQLMGLKTMVIQFNRGLLYWDFFLEICNSCSISDSVLCFINKELLVYLYALHESTSDDVNRLLQKILRILAVTCKKCTEDFPNFIELANELLLAIPSSTNPIQPRCRSTETRIDAFKLLLTLCSKNAQNLKLLMSELDSYHETMSWRNSKVRNWFIPLQRSEKSALGYIGLENPGCICYMNSVLQQLYMIEPFRDCILQTRINNKDSVAYQLQTLFAKMKYRQASFISTKTFLKNFKDIDGKPVNISEQMDADEFFARLMEKLEVEMREIKEESVVEQYFGGTHAVEKISKDCSHKYKQLEYFRSISLDVKNKMSLQESLNSFVSGEILKGQNAYFCQQCQKKVTAQMRTSIESLPNFLIFALRRFEFNFDTMLRTKVNDLFEFPTELNMLTYTSEYLNKEMLKNPGYYEYTLKGIIIHTGTADHGHYYSYVFNGDIWIEFNDINISLSDIDSIIGQAYGKRGHDSGVVPSAYLLIYERQNKFCFSRADQILNFQYNQDNADIQEIERKNIEHWKKKIAFSLEYLQFHQSMAESFMGIQRYILRFFLTISIRVDRYPHFQTSIYKYLEKNLKEDDICYLLDILTSENGIKEFLLYCPHPGHRKLIVLLVKNTIQQLDEQKVVTFFYRYLRMANYAYKEYSMHHTHYLELLVFFCRMMPDQCLQYDIATNVVKNILSQPTSIPSNENDSDDHLGYNKKYENTNRSSLDDLYGISKLAAITYISDSIYAINETMIEYIKSQDGIKSLLEICETKYCRIAVCKLFANLFFGDAESAISFVNYLFSRYFESSSNWYLGALTLFLKYSHSQIEIMKNFLELFIAMIPQESVQNTIALIKYFFKMVRKIKLSDIIEFFPADRLEAVKEWLYENRGYQGNFVKYYEKLDHFCKDEDIGEEYDSDDEISESTLIVGNVIQSYDRHRKAWHRAQIIENLHNEFIVIKYRIGEEDILEIKELNSFCELYPSF